MIQQYEEAILGFFGQAVPTIKKFMYAEKEELFEVWNEKKESPSFYYNRTTDTQALTKLIQVVGKGEPIGLEVNNTQVGVTNFYVVPMSYKGYIMVEKQIDLLNIMADLRFYWNSNPYLSVVTPTEDGVFIPVALRLLYIKIEEIRSNKDEKGPLRCIECSWDSQLFISKKEVRSTYEQIILTVNKEHQRKFNLPNN